MKFVIDHLQIGDVVQARVTEVLDRTQVIISLHGDLIRAENETGRHLANGDLVSMRVISRSPLQLRVLGGERSTRGHGRLNVVT